MKYILYILLMFFGSQVFGQTGPLNRALKLYQNDELKEARVLIDSVIRVSDAYANLAVTHYIKGFIYKDLYKSQAGGENEEARKHAVEAFNQVLRLDTTHRYNVEVIQNLKYLATTYYNDALQFIDENNFKDAESRYGQFERITIDLNDSTFQLTPGREQFYLALGTGFARQNDLVQDTSSFKKAEAAFKKVLEKDSLNLQANYNLGRLYYNEAVNKIDALGFDEDLSKFGEFEDTTIQLFKMALPYMQTAYSLDPRDENVLQGLTGIYYGLRDFEMSQKYELELRMLKK